MRNTILLVEDSADDVLFMSRALKKGPLEYSLQVADDGRKAVEYLSGHGRYADRATYPIPQLVLLDLKLPQLSGFDVLRWIREQPACVGLVVVVLTSSDHPSDIRQSYALGANSYLIKPANPEGLTELIRDIMYYWFKKNLTTDSTVASQSGDSPPDKPVGPCATGT